MNAYQKTAQALLSSTALMTLFCGEFGTTMPALAQASTTTAIVVQNCDSVSGVYSAAIGMPRATFIDQNGLACTNAQVSGVTFSGTIGTVNQGTPNTGAASGWWAQIEAFVGGSAASGLTGTVVSGSTALDTNVVQSVLPSGAATAANQSHGTAGTPSSVVVTVQAPVSGGTAMPTAPYPETVTGYTQITSLTAAEFPSVPATTTHIDIFPEGISNASGLCLRYRDDGTTATSGVGIPLAPLQDILGYTGSFANLNFINASGATCEVNLRYWK